GGDPAPRQGHHHAQGRRSEPIAGREALTLKGKRRRASGSRVLPGADALGAMGEIARFDYFSASSVLIVSSISLAFFSPPPTTTLRTLPFLSMITYCGMPLTL